MHTTTQKPCRDPGFWKGYIVGKHSDLESYLGGNGCDPNNELALRTNNMSMTDFSTMPFLRMTAFRGVPVPLRPPQVPCPGVP